MTILPDTSALLWKITQVSAWSVDNNNSLLAVYKRIVNISSIVHQTMSSLLCGRCTSNIEQT